MLSTPKPLLVTQPRTFTTPHGTIVATPEHGAIRFEMGDDVQVDDVPIAGHVVFEHDGEVIARTREGLHRADQQPHTDAAAISKAVRDTLSQVCADAAAEWLATGELFVDGVEHQIYLAQEQVDSREREAAHIRSDLTHAMHKLRTSEQALRRQQARLTAGPTTPEGTPHHG